MATALDSWTLKDVPTGSGTLRCAVVGEGPPVVFLHGLGGTWEYWQAVFARLRHDATLVGIDLPGFGNSTACDPDYDLQAAARRVAEALDALGLDRDVTIVGHSLGGAIAVELAALGVGSRLALLARVPIERLVALMPVQVAALKHLDRWESWPLRHRWARRATFATLAPDAGEFTPEDTRILLRGAARATQSTEAARSIAQTDVGLTAAGLDLPTIACFGTRDAVVPHRVSARVLEAIPHARLVTWPGLGHMPMLRRPDLVVEAIRTLLPMD
jgi:pimeloyl-ACP methyl ester carboxylesterase